MGQAQGGLEGVARRPVGGRYRFGRNGITCYAIPGCVGNGFAPAAPAVGWSASRWVRGETKKRNRRSARCVFVRQRGPAWGVGPHNPSRPIPCLPTQQDSLFLTHEPGGSRVTKRRPRPMAALFLALRAGRAAVDGTALDARGRPRGPWFNPVTRTSHRFSGSRTARA